jgi:peptidoglycan/LPS O-acetylase OafA/YrhL
MLGSMGIYAAYHWLINTNVYFPPSYPIFATIILCAITLALRTRYTIGASTAYGVVSFISGFTYTLFLVHYSVLSAAVSIVQPTHTLSAMWLAIAASQLVAITLAQIGEKNASTVRTALLSFAEGGMKHFIMKRQ